MFIGDRNSNLNQMSFVQSLLTECRNAGLLQDPRYAWALEILLVNPGDIQMREYIQEKLDEYRVQQLIKPDLFQATNPVTPENISGRLKVGFIEYSGIKYGIEPDDFVTSMFITGRAGGGKTSIALIILAQFLELKRTGLVIFDRKKDYECLVPLFGNFYYVHYTAFHDNALRPPANVPVRSWLGDLFTIMSNYFDLRVPSRNMMMDKALWLFKEKKSGDTGRYPTLTDLYFLIKNTKYPLISHEARYAESITNRLKGILDLFGDNLCSKVTLNWERLMSVNFAIGLDGLPVDYQNFFIAMLTSKIRQYTIAN